MLWSLAVFNNGLKMATINYVANSQSSLVVVYLPITFTIIYAICSCNQEVGANYGSQNVTSNAINSRSSMLHTYSTNTITIKNTFAGARYLYLIYGI